MSVVLSRPIIALYREEQNFAWWVYATMVLILLLGLGAFRSQRETLKVAVPAVRNLRSLEVPLYIFVGVALPSALVVGVLHLTTEVAPGVCRIWYGWLPTYRRSLVLAQVERIEIVHYDALKDHGFWGVRRARDGELVFTARGNRGVRLFMTDGSRVLIGTQRPEELAATLDRERRAAA
jgi:hypothetical protein